MTVNSASRVSKGNVKGRLKDKVALITGVGGGMGRDAALLFAQAGAQVVGCDIDREALDGTLEAAEAENLAIEVAAVNASDKDAVTKWVDDAAERHGGIDVLYNNGAHAQFNPFPDVTSDQWHETLRDELDIVFFPSQAVWNHMIERGGGSIINVGSGLAARGMEEIGGIGQTPHAAGKGGVLALTTQLACEGARHWIRVNAVSPGPIVTPIATEMIEANPEFRALFEGVVLLRRAGAPLDVVFASLFLASDESAFITGANLAVDGGATIFSGLSFNYSSPA